MTGSSDQSFKFQRGEGQTLLIACGALAREVIALIELNEMTHLDVTCLPANLHHRPALIPEAIRDKIRKNRDRYKSIHVLYGDCGTAGALDRVLEEEGDINRISGPHCFSFFMGNDNFDKSSEENITTFYLTDFFCKNFDKIVWEPLGLDRSESMLELVFGNYETLLFMPQVRDHYLEEQARKIAIRLGLEYRYQFAGYGEMETFIIGDTGDSNSVPLEMSR